MRLRERGTIREPDRYEGVVDESHTMPRRTRSRIMPASARPAFPPPYDDYNPNVPPATFPTLDAAVPAANKAGGCPGVGNNAGDGGGGTTGLAEGNDGAQTERLEGAIGTTDDRVELDAHDGDSDENAAGMVSSDEEMDADETVDDEPEFKVPDQIAWGDLTLALKAEIIGNMALVYKWPYVMSLLDLSLTERREAFETLATWDKLAARENMKLNEMREKQRRALLRIDNSILTKMRVPAQLVFRNISKAYLRDPRAREKPDCFVCKASEVLTAREFLRRRELDPGFAGQWTNGFATFHVDENRQEADRLGWKAVDALGIEQQQEQPAFEQNTVSQLGPTVSGLITSESQEDSRSQMQVQNKVGIINQLNSGTGLCQQALKYNVLQNPFNAAHQILLRKGFQKQGRFICPAPPDTAGSSAYPEEPPHLQVTVGPNGAARIQSDGSTATFPTEPARVEQLSSSPPRTQEDAPVAHSQPAVTGAGSANMVSTSPSLPQNLKNVRRGRQDLPLERVLSGSWWYGSQSQGEAAAATPSGNLNSRLFAARAEAELQRVAQEKRSRKVDQGGFQTNLPVRTASLGSAVAEDSSSQSNAQKTNPLEVYPKDGNPTVQGSKDPSQDQTQKPADSCETSAKWSEKERQHPEEESPRAPPFSPITPPPVSASFVQQLKEIAEQDNSTPTKIDSPKPTEATEERQCLTEEDHVKTDIKEQKSSTEKDSNQTLPQETPAPTGENHTAPKSDSGRGRKRPGGSRATHTPKRSSTERTPGRKTTPAAAASQDEPPTKRRKTSKKDTPSTAGTSPHPQATEGRSLRPRLSEGSEKKA